MSQRNFNYHEFNRVGDALNKRLFVDTSPHENLAVVLVAHSLFTSLPTIDAAETLCGKDNLRMVFKSSSQSDDFESHLVQRGNLALDVRKEDFRKRPDLVIRALQHTLEETRAEKILLLDHGGYGAYHWNDLKSELPIAGVVEYGLNGEKRYEQLDANGIPFASVAQSAIKKDADYSAGRVIGHLGTNISQGFRGYGMHMRHMTRVGVIGFGKLASRAAQVLRDQGAHNIVVYDTDPAKMIEASGLGYNISATSVEELVERCNFIIVGTDNAPIKPEMYGLMRDQTMIATVTSPDDTLDIDTLLAQDVLTHAQKVKKEPRITTYSHGDKEIHLIEDGDAANLKSPFGVDDPTLFMPLCLHALVGHALLDEGEITPGRCKN